MLVPRYRIYCTVIVTYGTFTLVFFTLRRRIARRRRTVCAC